MGVLLQGVTMKDFQGRGNHDHSTGPQIYTNKLSNNDILTLQDIFLTKGLHPLHADSLETGRSIIYTIVQSLHYYETIGCITVNQQLPLANPIINVYQDAYDRFGSSYTLEDIETMFLDYWFIEYAWIEHSQSSLSDPLYNACTRVMRNLGIIEHIPVIELVFG